MDIKDLNKPQLLLLSVLLSFVTSLATGITTVTLMQQAPDSVVTPVNRIIKQTVEKIQQVEGKTVTQTVVVKEEDLVVDAIAKNKSAVFVITKMGIDVNGINTEVPTGVGFAVNNSTIVADGLLAPGAGEYFAKNDSGKFKADFVSAGTGGFSFLKIGAPQNGTDKLVMVPPAFGDLDKMKVGQKVIVMGSSISSFIFDEKNITISTNVSNAGGLVLNLDGEALGIALSGAASFAPINAINDALKALNLPAAAPTPGAQ